MRILAIAGLVALAALGALLAYAPYLPALVAEGYPDLAFPGRGSFAQIGGGAGGTLDISPYASSTQLVEPLATAFADKGGRALLVARGGRLELEHYAPGVDAGTRLNSFSMVKTLVGALVYKALDERRLASLDQTLAELLPDVAPAVAQVTVGTLLTMTAGIHFDGGGKLGDASGKDSDTAPNPFGPLARLHYAGLAAVAPTLTVEPGTTHDFNYQNINTALLGAVLERLYGRPLEQLLDEKLWSPAGAGEALWRRPNTTLPVSAYCCLYATARDWVRVGMHLVRNGTFGAPFLSPELWRAFLGLDATEQDRHANRYGAHIRQNILDRPGEALQGPFSYALGQGGQMLYLMPERELVVYRAGDEIPLLHSTLYGAWNSLPAVGADPQRQE